MFIILHNIFGTETIVNTDHIIKIELDSIMHHIRISLTGEQNNICVTETMDEIMEKIK